MVYINLEWQGYLLVVHCHRNAKDGEYFRLVIDTVTKEVVEKPEHAGVDASAAYSHIYNWLESGAPLPKETVAAWG